MKLLLITHMKARQPWSSPAIRTLMYGGALGSTRDAASVNKVERN